MAEPTENGILEYLESVRAPENAETFTEAQTGLGREGFRKYIPDPTQVADFLNFPKKDGLRTLAPEKGEPSIIRQILNKIPEHNEQEMMDEYYGEYPEKRKETALGILSAFPAAGTVRLLNFLKNPAAFDKARMAAYNSNLLSDPFLETFSQYLLLGTGLLGTGLEKRKRREKEAEEMDIPFSEHPDFKEMANGGEIDPYSMLDPNPDLSTIPETPTLDSIAKFFLPVTEEGELSKSDLAFEAASMFPPLFWMKGLKFGTNTYNRARKIQDEIEDLKDVVAREKINAPTDGSPATNAAFRAQQDIHKKENALLKLVKTEDPEYGNLVEEASRRRFAQSRLEADPLYDTKVKKGIITAIPQGGDELFDIAGNLKDPKYNKILEEGYRKNRELAEVGIGSLQNRIRDALTKKTD